MNIRIFFSAVILIFSNLLFSQAKNQNTVTQDNFVKILWLDKTGKLQINEEYIKTITNQQRAALGYIATSVGNDCYWDGDKKTDESNLKCKFLWALNLGYQCSDTHLSFLRKWFKDDKYIIERLQNCTKTESSAKIQDRFIELKMVTNNKTIKIIYTAIGFDLETQQKWKWSEESTYSFTENGIKQTDRKNINGGIY